MDHKVHPNKSLEPRIALDKHIYEFFVVEAFYSSKKRTKIFIKNRKKIIFYTWEAVGDALDYQATKK